MCISPLNVDGLLLDINEKWKLIWEQLPNVTDVSIHFKVCRSKKHCIKYCGSGILPFIEMWLQKNELQKAQYVIKLSLNYIS